MPFKGGELIEEGGDHKGDGRGPESHEGRPSAARLPHDCRHSGHAGEIQEHEEKVGEGTDAPIETGFHGPEGTCGNSLFLSSLFLIREIPEI